MQLLEIAGDAVEGSYYVDHADVKAPDLTEFREQYKAAYGKDIEITAVMGHDALMLMKAAIEKAGVAEPGRSVMPWRHIEGVKVLTGEINMNPKTHNPDGKSAVIIKIENGEFVYYKTFTPKRDRKLDFLGEGKKPSPNIVIYSNHFSVRKIGES